MFYVVVDFMILGSLIYVVRRLLSENKQLRDRLTNLESRPECILKGRRSITGVITLFHQGRQQAARAIFDVDRR